MWECASEEELSCCAGAVDVDSRRGVECREGQFAMFVFFCFDVAKSLSSFSVPVSFKKGE